MICKQVLLIRFLNEPELIFLHTVKWSNSSISNNLLKHKFKLQCQAVIFHPRTLSGTTTLGQREPESDTNEGYYVFPKAPILDPHHQIV